LKKSRVIFAAIILTVVLLTSQLFVTQCCPVTLYAHVFDQHGNPVSGAEVLGHINYSVAPMTRNTRVIKTTTDEKGYFQFTRMFGNSLNLRITKLG